MDSDSKNTNDAINYGKIISVRGSVVDMAFESDLPPIYTLLHAEKTSSYLLKYYRNWITIA